ncbi:2-C-methyl-D-erythritol 4-phosphate cytidylyltransferase [Lysinibacillus sphaericus]|uniref:2-C-methyl-D-erythritol 4-phosphate cytidylyltransferase n=1 Tax=Lysinibacillus sphaericus TaxID=1421 RepID=UPI0018CD5752|nr:2-C-methyl-D-erythritol 4-phosphate cytidylyltransferase [Lysinibacillus sphaericus]MBG9454826.1 2-C-methyl-D-erythritol 4-phosphate cytidylyltransferase [Lysinibacillus sphaericus]MBG9478254.1 2-C-methyl-D-erythritol 4-phosphate cytidylyltransferase [Lysinibacillus sphaericus]MBG9590967.1 2-C-methyl-D-erythritol 4-phosphate cytidylyltransferase [Lysinibacillus sphaericus]
MNYGIILASGIGSRMGIVDKPKQFIDVYGKPIIIHTLEAFANHPEIDRIIIVTLDEWIDDVRILIRRYEIDKVMDLVVGGDTRQASVYAALCYLQGQCNDDDIVVVHDAVRPLVSQRIISSNIEGAKLHGAVDTVIPSADTVVESKNTETISQIPKRDYFYLGQTPQSFTYSLLKESHDYALEHPYIETTDDCKLVLQLNHPVYLVKGEKLNFKVTTFEDLLLFKAILKLGSIEVI